MTGRSGLEACRRGFTLIELLVVIAVIGILLGLLLPAVQMAREAARRSLCVNNLKQLALATHYYERTWDCYPQGVQFTFNMATASHWVAQLPFYEQQPLFNAINFDWHIVSAANTTVVGVRLPVLMCPSDPLVNRLVEFDGSLFGDPVLFYPGPTRYALCSYKGCAGIWFHHSWPPIYRRTGGEGMFLEQHVVRPSEVSDGLSQTVLYSEASMRILNEDEIRDEGPWWATGWVAGTLCLSFYAINPNRNAVTDARAPGGLYHAYSVAVSSEHPGGANVAMVDGSVRFIKESINTWRINPLTGLPFGWRYDPSTANYIPGPNAAQFGVWQKITTRDGNDIVGGSDY